MARLSRFDREVVELACARVLLDMVRSLWIGMGVAEEYARGTGPDGPLHACARPPRVNQTKGSRPVSGLARDALTVAGQRRTGSESVTGFPFHLVRAGTRHLGQPA